MLIPKNYANQMRSRILVKVVESFYKDRFETADEIPIEIPVAVAFIKTGRF